METRDHRRSLSTIVDNVHRALIPTSTKNELAQRVCEQFADSPFFTYAWVGEYNARTNTVIPKATAGVDPDTFDTLSLSDEVTDLDLLRRAIDSHALQVHQNPDETSIPPICRDDTVADEVQARAILPLVHDDTLYGVLELTTGRDDFDTPERDTLSELADQIGYALADIENHNRDQHQRVRDALSVEDEFINSALESLPELFYVFDLEGNFLHWNKAVEEVTGYDEDDILSMHPVDFFASDDIDRIADAIDRIIDGGREQVDATLVTKDGERIPVEATGTLLENEDGDILGICGTARDITERQVREQQITRQRDQLAALKDHLLETVPTGIVMFDTDGESLQFNDRATEILGTDPADVRTLLRNDSDWNIVDGSGNPVSPSDFPVNRVLATGDPVFNEELRIDNPNEKSVWLSVNAAPLSDHSGEPTVVVAFEDITERKTREQELQAAKEQLEAAVEAGGVGTWEWHIPDDEWVTRTSFAHTIGVDPDAAREGVSIDRVLSAIHEDDRERVERKVEDAIDSCGECEAEYRVWDDNDELRWVMGRGYVECDADGNPVRFLGAHADITERKQAEQALRESEEQLQTLIELLPVGVLVADADGQLVETNEVAEELWGGFAEAENVAEYDRYTGWWVDSGERVAAEEWPLARALRGEEVTDPDIVEIEGFNGERRIVMLHAMPIRDEAGEVQQAVVTMTDITERKERERRLQRQNNRLESFASMVAHELRNPLSIAQIYLQNARSGDDTAFEEVDTALDRIEEMIDILLVLTREADSGISSEPVSLADMAQDVWSNLDLPVEQLKVDSDVTLIVEPHHFQHILENLFENAVDHAGDAVTVRVGRLDDGFYVADDGSGIPETEGENVFEAGFSTDENGIGLGLTFIAQLSEAYGWEYRVTESRAGGARFEFTNVKTLSAE